MAVNRKTIFTMFCFAFMFAGMLDVRIEFGSQPKSFPLRSYLINRWLQPEEIDFEYCESLIAGDSRHPRIIFASTYFENEYDTSSGSLCSYSCVYLPSKCRRFQSLVRNVRAVVLHGFRPDLIPALRDLAPTRANLPSDQLWVFLSLETPITLKSLVRDILWSKLNEIFNLSLSYRHDSDIHVPPLGFDGYDQKLKDDPVTRSFIGAGEMAKRRHVAAIISNCHDSSGRLTLLNELKKYGVTVDIYGKCGTEGLNCPGERGTASGECYSKLNGSYLFYAAFENSICRDYITEKFYAVLDYDFVPLVLGGANYTAEGPPNSFIDAKNFTSIQDLAKYLLQVANDPQLYNSYFDWKQHLKVRKSQENSAMCSLCRKLHQLNTTKPKSLNLAEWWDKGSKCTNNHLLS